MESQRDRSWDMAVAAFWKQLQKKKASRRSGCRIVAPKFSSHEVLEDRIVLTPFYDLSVVASTTDGFVGFGDLASINNNGTVAFVGYRNDYDSDGNLVPDDIRESGLWTAEPTLPAVNINPNFTDTNGRDFGRAVAINDDGVLTARDRLDPNFFLREWDSTDKNDFTDIVTTKPGLLTFAKYSAFQTFTDINNNGDVAFVSQSPDGKSRTLELYQNGQPPGTTIKLNTFPSGAAGGPSPRPQLTDDGHVLARLENDTIVLFDETKNYIPFVGVGEFSETGAAPGVTADGRVVVFTGNRGYGPGVFAAYYSAGTRHIVRVAGEGLDGWTDFDLNSAVRVSGSMGDDSDRGVTVVFEGSNSTVGHGIYAARVSFYGESPYVDYDSNSIFDVRVSGAAPVALVGDTVEFGGPKITEVEPYGINDQGRGELAFWVKMGSHEAIVRAKPQQVVFINLLPGIIQPGGGAATGLDLLEEVGVSNGWPGTFGDALTDLGFVGNPFSLGPQIRAQVQQYFDATGARVRIVDTEPVAVTRTTVDSTGHVLEVNAAFQQIEVGQGPSARFGDLGLAARGYVRGGALDFYNQVVDDVAVVFVDRIFASAGFTKPFNQLTNAERVQAIADVIAHEAGHNFGLVHTRRDFSDDLMHGGTNTGEFEDTQEFSQGSTLIDPSMHVLNYSETPADRLVYSTGGIPGNPGEAPNSIVIGVSSAWDSQQRHKIAGSLINGDQTVARLLVGTTNDLGLDLIPTFHDLGGGSLADLLSGAGFMSAATGNVILIGSTDGTRPDIIGIPASQAGAQDSLELSAIGIIANERLQGRIGEGFNLYHLPETGPAELIGSFTVEGEPAASVFVGDGQLDAGSALGLGETVPGGGALTKVITIRNTGAAQLNLGTVVIAGAGYSVTQPAQPALAPGAETTVTVTLSDATAGIGLTGTLTIPSNDSRSPFTLTVHGTVDARPRVIGVTRIDNGTGPVRVAIDFSGQLKPGPAAVAANYTIARETGETFPVDTATYSQTANSSRVELTLSVSESALATDDYLVRFDGTQVVSATGAPLATTRENLLSHQVLQTGEIVTIGSNGSGSAAVLSGPEPTGYSPPKLVVSSDFNGDGIQDLVATGELTGNLLFYRGLADGGYETSIVPLEGPTPTLKAAPLQIMAADWNGDGVTDLVIFDSVYSYYEGFYQRILVLLNDGSGTFTAAPDTPIPASVDDNGQLLGVADFTGDGLIDVAISGPETDGVASVAIYGKDPFLGYSRVAVISTEHPGWFPQSAVTADLNADGRLDLVVATDGFYGDVPRPIVFMNSPTGLILADDLSYTGETGAPTVADFTGDGKLDIAIVSDYYSVSGGIKVGSIVSVLVGDGAGHFSARPYFALHRRGVSLIGSGDLNHDGKADLVLRADAFQQTGFDTTSEISEWTIFGDGFGNFDLSEPLIPLSGTGNTSPGSFELHDLNSDGFLDVIFGNQTSGQVGVLVNDGAGHLVPSRSGPLTSTLTQYRAQLDQMEGIVIADLNRDGFPDQLRPVNGVYSSIGQAIDVLWGDVSGEFHIVSSLIVDPYFYSPHSQYLYAIGAINVGDLNNDGWLDLVLVSDSSVGGALEVFLGVNGRDFVPAPNFAIDAGAGQPTFTGQLADVNGDGNLDFVAVVGVYSVSNSGVTSASPTGFGVFFGDGTGKLIYNANAFQSMPGFQLQVPTIADVNGDQKLDILIGSTGVDANFNVTSPLLVYLGLGNGRFTLGQTLLRSESDSEPQVYLLDINRDGKLDVVSPNETNLTMDFYLGNGAGQFVAAPDLSFAIPYKVAHLAFGDFTGDGFDDLALTEDTTSTAAFTTTLPIFAGDGQGHFADPQLIDTGSLWPNSVVIVPVAGIIEAGSFSITRPILSVPAGMLNISTATSYEQPVGINPRPLLPAYTKDPVGLAVSVLPQHGSVTIQNNATPGNLNDDTFSYQPANGFSGTDTFTYQVADGRGGTATGVVTITVAPANQNPLLTLTPGPLNYFFYQYEDRLIDSGATIANVDSASFRGANLIIQIANGFNPEYDFLGLDAPGNAPGELNWDSFDGTLSYSGTVIGNVVGGYHEPLSISFTTAAATPALVQTVLRHVTYANTDFDRSVSQQRTLFIQVTDGDGGGSSATKTILLPAEGSNLAPVVTTSSSNLVYTIGSPATIIDGAATVSDADSANFDGGSLTVDFPTFNFFDDRLAIRTQGTGTGQINLTGNTVKYGSIAIGTFSGGVTDSSALVVSFNSNATPAIVQALLRQITFASVDDNPGTQDHTIRVVVDDGQGGISAPATRIISFVAGNSPPEITLSNGTTSYPADQTAVTIDAGVFVDDFDSDDFDGGSLTVSFVSGQSSADRLAIRNEGTALGQINLSGNTVKFGSIPLGTYSGGFTTNSALVILFNTNASPARVELLIRQLTFQIASASPTTTDRVIQFVVNDGDGATSQPASKTIVVAGSGSNEAPTIQLSAGSPTYSKLGPAVAIDSQVVVTGPTNGAGTIGGGVLTISVNDVNTGKTKFDVFNVSALNNIGTSRGTQLVSGRWVTIIDLDSDATAQLIQNALRSVTFQTSKKGLKFATRTVRIQLADSEGDASPVVTKTINVSKKRVK